MKRTSLIYSVIMIVSTTLFFTNCSVKNQVKAELKNLDSLNIVLATKLSELNKCDTTLLTRAILKFTNHSIFIENNLNDTITKTEANGLQQFYVSGNNLKAFAVNRLSLITRSRLVVDQVIKLREDLNHGLISRDDFLKNYDTETKAETQLILLIDQEIKNYNNNMQDFRNSVFLVESLLKSINNGQLPEETKDCVNI